MRRTVTVEGLLRSGAGIAVAMLVMNVGNYAFQIVAARVLGPAEYGAVASLMAILMVMSVVQLGLQAVGARRIAAEPDHVAQIEGTVLAVTWRAALGFGAVMLLGSPIVWWVLRLETPVPAVLLALSGVPLTVMGGQAGILQGERRWLPLGMVYLAVGVPRVLLGALCVLIHPSVTSAMVGVALGMLVPAAVGYLALRGGRPQGAASEHHRRSQVTKEAAVSSLALLGFFALSNVDIVVARSVLDSRAAGLYAGGLILTKAVLFLPQFVVVVLFPSMSTEGVRRPALLRGMGMVMFLGLCSVVGALVLSSLAIVFVGGAEYSEVEPLLWQFAVLGTLLSGLQLLVYSVLARRGTRSTYLVWLAVLTLAGASLLADSLRQLVATVIAVDATLFVVLLGLSLWQLRGPTHPPAQGGPTEDGPADRAPVAESPEGAETSRAPRPGQ